VTIKDYGCISFHFDKVMDAKGITRNKLAMLTGIRFEVADRLYKGIIERMDIDVLARVCFVLDCQVGDVIKYDK
jgi:putative transcriptional regulator